MNLSTSPSLWQRSRNWSTIGCLITGALALVLLVQGHGMHGALTLLAFGVLLRDSVLSSRARRQAAVANLRRAYHGANR